MHPVQILDCLPRRAFAEIVEARNDHEPLAGRIERKTDIAEIRVRHMLQFRQPPRGQNANHRPPRVKLAIERFDFVRLTRADAATHRASRESRARPEADAS